MRKKSMARMMRETQSFLEFQQNELKEAYERIYFEERNIQTRRCQIRDAKKQLRELKRLKGQSND